MHLTYFHFSFLLNFHATIAPNHATRGSPAIKIELHCSAADRRKLEVELHRRGCAFTSDVNIVVMVDVRVAGGRMALSRINERHVVFVTANPCPEYRLDICTHHRQSTLFASRDPDEIVQAVRRLHDDPNQPAPTLESPLSPHERSVLHGVALGWSDHLISEGLSIKSNGRAKSRQRSDDETASRTPRVATGLEIAARVVLLGLLEVA